MDEAIGRHGCLFSQQTWIEAIGSFLSKDSETICYNFPSDHHV